MTAYPILQNLSSIPVLAIFVKYNLVQLGWLDQAAATVVAFALPWAASIPFYTGTGFDHISEVGGFAFSLVINFVVPVALWAVSRGSKDEETSSEEESLSKLD